MPVFEVASPTGEIFEVEVPEGVTEEDVLNHFQQQSAPSQGPSISQSLGKGLLKGFGGLLEPFRFPQTERAPTAGVDPQLLEAAQRFARPSVLDPSASAAAMPSAVTPGGRFAEQVGEFAGGAAIPAGGLARNIALGAVGGAGAGTAEALGGGDTAQLIAAIGASGAGGAVPGGSELIKRIIRGRSPQGVQAALSEAAEAGTTPTLAQATGGNVASKLEGVLERTYLGGRLRKLKEAQAQAVGAKVEELAPKAAESMEGIGTTIQKGIKGYSRKSSKKGEGLYDEALSGVGGESNLPATREVLSEMRSDKFAALLDDPYARKVAETLSEGPVDFDTLRQVRSRLGEHIKGTKLTGTPNRAQLERIYGSLSDDIKDIARREGKESELVAADAFWQKKKTLEKELARFVGTKQGVTPDPEKIYASIERGGTSLVNRLKKVLSPKEFKAFGDTKLRRLGETQPGGVSPGEPMGDFNMDRFLTQYKKVPPSARKALWGDREEPLRKLVALAERARQSALKNPSGTGAVVANKSLMGASAAAVGLGVGASIPTLITTAAVVNLTGLAIARGMTSPKVLNWLAKQSGRRLPLEAFIAEANQVFGEDVRAYFEK